MKRFFYATAMLVALLAGCTVGPDYHAPQATVAASYKELAGWTPASPASPDTGADWWSVYRDPVLDELEQRVAVSNQSLRASEAVWRNARAAAAFAEAAQWPAVGATGGFTRAGRGGGASGTAASTAALEAAASWDIDLWGRIRRSVESAKSAAQASAADLAAAQLSLQATLASDYFALRAADAQRRLLNSTAAAYEKSLRIARNQYAAGTAARSDVIVAKAQLETTRAKATDTGVQRAALEHAIAELTGRTPDSLSIAPAAMPSSVPVPPVGLPATLLQRRPDIAAAERRMQQQNAQIGVAVAAFYPDISLSALAGYAGNPALGLTSVADRVWSLGAAASLPLFVGGARSAAVDSARAAYDESVAVYRGAVLGAFQNVEDDLAALRVLQDESGQVDGALASARDATRIALNEYEAGTTVYTTVVTAQAAELGEAQTAIALLLARLQASVSLIEAVGGGWSSAHLPPRRAI
jgi:NodT family efflux transporter outer membrane factor (OMF) lipoprotein